MKTAVAPALGGPLDGRLLRMSIVDERYLVPQADGAAITYHEYLLMIRPDGSRVWAHQDSRKTIS